MFMGKYFSLRLVSSLISIIGFIFLGIALIEAAIMLALSKYKTLDGNEFLEIANKVINSILYFKAGEAIFWGLILFVLFQAVAQQIRVFIDIEKNSSNILVNSKIELNHLKEIRRNLRLENESMTCPRCYGKGHVDHIDIQRLALTNDFFGACGYCNANGKVAKGSSLNSEVTNIYSNDNHSVIDEEVSQENLESDGKFPFFALGLISISIFLFQLSSKFDFNWVFLLIGSGLLLYSWNKPDEIELKQDNYSMSFIAVGIFILLGFVFDEFYWSTLILAIAMIVTGIVLNYNNSTNPKA
jgi:hypothetical protein